MRSDFVVNEGAGAVNEYGGRRIYPVCVAEKGVFRFTTLSTEAAPVTPRSARLGDNALARMGPLLTALRERRASFALNPEAEAFLGALGHDPADPEALPRSRPPTPPGRAARADAGHRRMAPDVMRAGEKINVIPSHAELQVDCRVPPEQGEEDVAARCRW